MGCPRRQCRTVEARAASRSAYKSLADTWKITLRSPLPGSSSANSVALFHRRFKTPFDRLPDWIEPADQVNGCYRRVGDRGHGDGDGPPSTRYSHCPASNPIRVNFNPTRERANQRLGLARASASRAIFPVASTMRTLLCSMTRRSRQITPWLPARLESPWSAAPLASLSQWPVLRRLVARQPL